MAVELTAEEREQVERCIREALGIPEMKPSDLVLLYTDPRDVLQMIREDEAAAKRSLSSRISGASLGGAS
jgi:hypothetical protein